ncbi:hypothetical protein E2C01_015659 [Portunus trituberculatus]|uniref:Uncharacterized protein n=1 Tax=Portunus trituberculatus TaxID=210409 RepID=A0A5B7DNK4_PORTR|nr:hypothetical protein [Portunus trituberculatus]
MRKAVRNQETRATCRLKTQWERSGACQTMGLEALIPCGVWWVVGGYTCCPQYRRRNKTPSGLFPPSVSKSCLCHRSQPCSALSFPQSGEMLASSSPHASTSHNCTRISGKPDTLIKREFLSVEPSGNSSLASTSGGRRPFS